MSEHFDVLIVGAGLSGIGAACHLAMKCPNKSVAVLEARATLGGTWDLFRYPGIRSDSDMYTLGYTFKPWEDQKAIADGPAILKYLRETAREHGVEEKIRFHHRVKSASWSSDAARWTVEVDRTGGAPVRMTCSFLYVCTGYYDYDQGHSPEFPGRERFQGTVVHPQLWPEGLDYEGKHVVVIGSGATAVTLVPAMAERAAHVVMLQRSPTYILSRPDEDEVANWLRRALPARAAYAVARGKNVFLSALLYQLSRRRPEMMTRTLLAGVRKELGPEYDIKKHFLPRYKPWDQRMCLVPNSDLFRAIRAGRASVVTDTIRTFSEKGVLVESGAELPADIIVTATGLKVLFMGDIGLEVDGRAVDPGKMVNYKGTMFSDVPNLAYAFGYTNASWTLKADLTADYVCRLIRHMDEVGADRCTPRRTKDDEEVPFVDLTSGYLQRALDRLPKQGAKTPWKLHQNYLLDILMLRLGEIEDGSIEITSRKGRRATLRTKLGRMLTALRA